MTEKQTKRKYWPAWAAVCRHLGWRSEAGRLVLGDAAKLNQHALRVVKVAEAAAAAKHRAPVLDDLRHAVHEVAMGRDKSSTKFTNQDLGRFLHVVALMIQETDIDADLRLNNPDLDSRDALVATINKLIIPFGIIDDVCKRSFAPVYNPPHWQHLPLANLRALLGIVRKLKEEYLVASQD